MLAWRDSVSLVKIEALGLDNFFTEKRNKQGNNAIMAIFKSSDLKLFAVATTHLHWNPSQ